LGDRVTVAIPVRDGERYLAEVLAAVGNQAVGCPVEILVVDSGSRDRSVEIARAAGARVVEIPPSQFSHGATRNLMMDLASGDHVAFLSQDATPADDRWLSRLLEGFGLARDVALVFGPYEARPGASATVARELRDYFRTFSSNGRPVLQSIGSEPGSAYRRAPGPLTFFSDANGCVARWAWQRVPYRPVPYAEDQLLGCEMLEAGYAKVFHPEAVVIHSHEYSPRDLLRRCFDEWRGLREVYGYVEPWSPRRHLARIRREVRADLALLRASGAPRPAFGRGLGSSIAHHSVRAAGSVLGSRADRLPAGARGLLSLEGRSTFYPSTPAT
jgi:glycosyltransferase involved in cell wall biosynthesis